jgi:hypothetical protein
MSSNIKNIPSTESQEDFTWIPEGFVMVTGPGGADYVIPAYIFPALQRERNTYLRRKELGAFQASGKVSLIPLRPLGTFIHSMPG